MNPISEHSESIVSFNLNKNIKERHNWVPNLSYAATITFPSAPCSWVEKDTFFAVFGAHVGLRPTSPLSAHARRPMHATG